MLDFIFQNLLWTEGFSLLVAFVIAALIGLTWYRPLVYVAVGMLLFSFYFFRNPVRQNAQTKNDSTILVCPADGKVVDVQYSLADSLDGYAQKVSIFLSLFDAHVTWAPYAGVITAIHYKPGTFTLAFLPKSSELNERNDIIIATKYGKIMVRQIAGTIARRICSFVHKSDQVVTSGALGMIRFGSRVEVFLPARVRLAIGVGQRVYGGQTILAHWQSE